MDIDELLDFSGDRDDIFSSNTNTNTNTDLFHNVTSSTDSGNEFQYSFNSTTTTTDFTDHFCLPVINFNCTIFSRLLCVLTILTICNWILLRNVLEWWRGRAGMAIEICWRFRY